MVGMNASAPVPMLFISAANLLGIGRSKRSRENSRRRRDLGRSMRRIVGNGSIRIEGQIMPGVIETPGSTHVEYTGLPMGFIYVPEGET